MEDPMADIMAQDDTVDETPDFGIMAGYVRAKVWETFADALGPRRACNHPQRDHLEDVLENRAPGAMAPILSRLALEGVFSSYARDLPGDNSIVFELWDGFTNDDVSHERKIEVVRGWYKKKLRGCIGVQPSGILRATLKDYSGESADDLPDYEEYKELTGE